MFPHTDLTFFTNEANQTLLQRFCAMLPDVQFFDVLVGYFRSSGFKQLGDALKSTEKIRILVGLNVDKPIWKDWNTATQLRLTLSEQETKKSYVEAIEKELENSEDSQDVVDGATTFIAMLKSGQLEIKAHPSEQIHAKVYIQRFHSTDRDVGRVITGSSNFSEAGLLGQYEFNVELKNRGDVEFALFKFEELWEQGVDLKEVYIETLEQKTWLKQVTPYQIYLKCLYEYFEEDINDDASGDYYLPEGFLKLQYQQQAVTKLSKIVKEYNGAFIADVVGLGKTPMAAMYASTLGKQKKLFIVPPTVKKTWEQTLEQFGVRNKEVESAGKLKQIVEKAERNGNHYDMIFVDEAHRFRSLESQDFDCLKRLAVNQEGQRVRFILISATPLNNSFYDFYPLLSLFQPDVDSDIPNISNLKQFFDDRRIRLKKIAKESSKDSYAYLQEVKKISKEVRERILRNVMVRRTRTDISEHFKEDLKQQNIKFPTIEKPIRLIYEFDNPTNTALEESIETIRNLKYVRYTPLLYLKQQKGSFEKTQQINLRGFIRSLMIKRLESSKFAFERTLGRAIQSYEQFIAMAKRGTVYISKKVDVYDYLDNDNEAELLKKVEEEEHLEAYPLSDFKDNFLIDLEGDLALLKALQTQWGQLTTDFKKERFIEALKEESQLKNQKIIIFTESKETGEDLYQTLSQEYPQEVVFFSSQSSQKELELVRQAFDPKETPSEEAKKYRILITTDVLAEGINLHRANCLVNYDLPWNPTRVLQRVGRVNRIGSPHTNIYIFNFFPTESTDKHLDLESCILAKIQAFHNALGEDAKYLSESEDLSAESFYQHLNSVPDAESGEELDVELKYLKIIRDIRDKDPALFQQIKRLPKKVRTFRQQETIDKEGLLTFVRRNYSKRFALVEKGKEPRVLNDLMEAMSYLECPPDTPMPKGKIPLTFFSYLEKNKQVFAMPEHPDDTPLTKSKGRGGVHEYVLHLLLALPKEPRLTETNKTELGCLLEAVRHGSVGKTTLTKIKQTSASLTDSLKMYQWIKANVPERFLNPIEGKKTVERKEYDVILSSYFVEET